MRKVKIHYKREPALRFALWKAHKCREYYYGGELDLAELEVDHIIPQSLVKKPTEYKEYLKLMGIYEDFEVNSIFNYVPTKKYINLRKSNDLLPPGIAAIALGNARKIAKKVEEIIELFDKNIEINEVITHIKTSVKNDQDIERVYDMLTDDTEEFQNRKYVNKEDIFRPYQYSMKRISLDAFLPSYIETEPSCMLLFRTLSIRGCMITLNNTQIINQLFKGIKTDPKYDLRGFIAHPSKQGGYYIQLASNRFILNKEETHELCSIIDDFTEEYMDSLIEIEKKLETINFKKTKKGAYKLVRISCTLWRNIVHFIANNDAYTTKGEWSIFEPNKYMIKVYTNNHPMYENGYHTIIHLEREYNRFFDDYCITDDKIWLVWKPHFTIHADKDVNDMGQKRNWNPQNAFKWLTEELIPKVIYEETIPTNIFGKPKVTYEGFIKKFDITAFIDTDFIYLINVKDIVDKGTLLDSIQKMQSFFSTYETIFLKKEEISDVYLAALKILENSNNIDIGYIAGNLGFTEANNYEKLIEDINNYINEIKDSIVGSFTIDTTLRCILVCLRDFKCSLSINQIQDVYYLIKPLIEIYNREALLKKDSDY